MKNNIVVFGEILFDVFPDSEKMGGAPFNLACHLTGFHKNIKMVSSVGQDKRGEVIIDFMHSNGMDTSQIKISDKYPTGLVEVVFEGGVHSFNICKDQAYDYINTEDICWQVHRDDFILCYGSLSLRGEHNRNELERLRSLNGCRIFCDLNLRGEWRTRELIDFTLKSVTWLKLNDEELEYLGQLYNFKGSYAEISRAVMDKFKISTVFLTMGGEGACIYTKDSEHCSRVVLQSSIKDTVGAGDAFGAVCLLGLLNGWDSETLLRSSIEFASAICGIRGAIPDDDAFYERFRRQWKL